MKHFQKCMLMFCACMLLFSFVPVRAIHRQGDEIVQVGDKLPRFSVVTTTGVQVSDSTLRGMPSVVVFFNTECGDCRKELPVLQKLYEEVGSDVSFLCIGRKEPVQQVADFWQAQALTLPCAPQPDRTIYELFARHTIPRVYISDASGVVRKVFVERVSERKLRRAIRKVCGEIF